jgi:hypothetical protein
MKMLTEGALRQYREQGYDAPVRVMDRQYAAVPRGALDSVGTGPGPLRARGDPDAADGKGDARLKGGLTLC